MDSILRGGDATLSFQLDDSDDIVVDVDTLTDLTATLIHKQARIEIAEYEMADLDIDSATNIIYIYMQGSVTLNEQVGIYTLRVDWSVVDANFPDASKDEIDESDIFILKEK